MIHSLESLPQYDKAININRIASDKILSLYDSYRFLLSSIKNCSLKVFCYSDFTGRINFNSEK